MKAKKMLTFIIAAAIYAIRKGTIQEDLDRNYKVTPKRAIEDADAFMDEAQSAGIAPNDEDLD